MSRTQVLKYVHIVHNVAVHKWCIIDLYPNYCRRRITNCSCRHTLWLVPRLNVAFMCTLLVYVFQAVVANLA